MYMDQIKFEDLLHTSIHGDGWIIKSRLHKIKSHTKSTITLLQEILSTGGTVEPQAQTLGGFLTKM